MMARYLAGMFLFNTPYRLFLFACLTLLLIGCCFWIRLINMPILDALEARGENTRAEVTWVGEPYWVWQRGNYSRGGWRVDMVYKYRTRAGAVIEDRKTLVKQNAKNLKPGYRFEVVYLPDDPTTHDSQLGNGYAGPGMIYALIPMIFVCIGMTVFYWHRRPPGWAGPKLWPLLASRSV
ncbi:MAG: DUF3592 domain-containing protein [Pseudomonadota bacterium]